MNLYDRDFSIQNSKMMSLDQQLKTLDILPLKFPFKNPLFKTNLGYFSLLNISIKILNSFLYDHLYLSPYYFNSFYKTIII